MRTAIPVLGLLSLAVVAPPEAANAWRDPSRHAIRFVAVEKDVRLEVLDWGGSGRPLVLLAGGGNTAHVFDTFAPKLTAVGHVYGITRRGFGASGFSPSENAVDRLRDDVLIVIDALGLERPVLVGHSIAGAELSAVAASRPGRIAGLAYLEAAYPYAFQNGSGPTMKQFFETNGPQAPVAGEPNLASFSALREWDASTFGFQTPESEFRQTWDSTPEGRPRSAREPPHPGGMGRQEPRPCGPEGGCGISRGTQWVDGSSGERARQRSPKRARGQTAGRALRLLVQRGGRTA